mmetsp:Transcript_18334/g.35351  ORF Transcript_18334/g.35351 Transcript_18334/m.35351 type:complete len:82 (+) Transcript_18334:50-295(+)
MYTLARHTTLHRIDTNAADWKDNTIACHSEGIPVRGLLRLGVPDNNLFEHLVFHHMRAQSQRPDGQPAIARDQQHLLSTTR